ncbi:MAG TPA: hypothetical protein DDW49_08120 [Deltaproteobacteria bacterium]|nr:hypothetical protein [Deltaproteobacteria bacterium]
MQTQSLHKIQGKLVQFITAPESVLKNPQSRKLHAFIKPSQTLTPEERVDIYANMYFFRLLEGLKKDFPGIHLFVGNDAFHNLVTDYLITHPPTHFSIRYAGQSFPEFLKKHRNKKNGPFLPDLALFEWDLAESFDAPDGTVLTKKDLSRLKPKQWAGFIPSLTPSLQLFSSFYDIAFLHKTLLNTKKTSFIKKEKERIFTRIWRKKLKVVYHPIDKLEYGLLKQIQKGKSFATLCEWLAGQTDPHKAVPLMAGFMQTWLKQGLLYVF